jgi:hypothetical protein
MIPIFRLSETSTNNRTNRPPIPNHHTTIVANGNRRSPAGRQPGSSQTGRRAESGSGGNDCQLELLRDCGVNKLAAGICPVPTYSVSLAGLSTASCGALWKTTRTNSGDRPHRFCPSAFFQQTREICSLFGKPCRPVPRRLLGSALLEPADRGHCQAEPAQEKRKRRQTEPRGGALTKTSATDSIAIGQ